MGWLYKDNKKRSVIILVLVVKALLFNPLLFLFSLLSSRQPYVKRFFVFDTTNLSLAYFKDESAAMAKTELDKGKFRLKDIQKVSITKVIGSLLF